MFRFVEHQADIAVELEAGSREELFQTALDALTALLTGDPDNRDTSDKIEENLKDLQQNTSIKANGFDDEERLIGLMNEFLYLCQVKGFYPRKTDQIAFNDQGGVSADLTGIFDRHDLQFLREIKAATYHDIIIRSGKVWKVKVVMDV